MDDYPVNSITLINLQITELTAFCQAYFSTAYFSTLNERWRKPKDRPFGSEKNLPWMLTIFLETFLYFRKLNSFVDHFTLVFKKDLLDNGKMVRSWAT
jgi:hypothetical protein